MVAETGTYTVTGFNARATFEVDMIISLTEQDKADIAAAILAAAQITPIHSNIQKVNDVEIKGVGTPSNPWNPV